MKTYLTVALIALVLTGSASVRAQAPGVIVSIAEIKSFPLSAEALGNARANESIEVRAEIPAALTGIYFTEGQRVAEGTILAKLENSQELAALAAAKAALVESSSQLKRSEELFKTNVVAASQLEQLKAKQEADQAAVNAAEARLEQTVIRAPFSGRLGLRRVSVGSVLDTNTVITTLDDTSVIKLDFDVPEVFLANLQPGLKVQAHSAAWPDSVFNGEVAFVDTRVDPITRTITVRALVPNEQERLRPGMFLTVSLLKGDTTALMIPEEAVVPESSKQYVFVVNSDELAELRQIRTGRRRPGEVEVLKGLAEGERVIAEGTQKARDGKAVQVIGQRPGGRS